MGLNKVLRYIVFGGIFLLPFLPFVVSGSMFFPFITGKNFLFRIAVEIMFASWLLLALRDLTYRPRKSLILWSLTLFVIIMFVADIFGVNFERSFWSNFERMEGFVTILHLLGYTVVVASVMQTQKLWTWFFRTSIGASIIMGVYGLFQLAGALVINQGGARVDGTFGNATYLAVYMLFHIFITLYLAVRHEGNKWWYGFYGVAILLQVYMLYSTATRGAILGLIGGVLLSALLIALFDRSRPRLRKTGIAAVLSVLILVGAFFGLRNTSFVEESLTLSRLSRISLTDRTTIARVSIWQMGWEGFLERPILGWGQENFNLIFNSNYDPEFYDQEQWFDRAHNVVFDWLTAGGILGLLAYLSILFAAVFLLWKSSTLSITERSIFTGLLAAYFFHNLFVFDNVVSYMLFGTVLAFLHTHQSLPEKEVSQGLSFLNSDVVRRIAPAVIVIGLLWALYFFNIPGIRASQTLIDSLRGHEQGPQENLRLFAKTIELDTFGTPEVREQLVTATRAIVSDPNISDDIKIEYVNTAQNEMQKQIDKTPFDTRYYVFMGGLLSRIGSFEEATTYFEDALLLSPDKQTILFELGQAQLASGNLALGLETFKTAYELQKDYEVANELYIVAALEAGEADLAGRMLEGLIARAFDDDEETNFVPDASIINAYIARGQFDVVAVLWEVRVVYSPDDAVARLSLAAAYSEIGLYDRAIEQIQEAISLDPNLMDQGDAFIQEIQSRRQTIDLDV